MGFDVMGFEKIPPNVSAGLRRRSHLRQVEFGVAARAPSKARISRTFASVDLYWLPLGAGDAFPIVRWNGRIFEALVARRQRREACDLYHSALAVRLGTDRYVIEMAPVWESKESDRGVARGGAVGSKWLGRFRLFRYEVRCWRGGVIPDAASAVASPRSISTDPFRARALIDLVYAFPTATWGRDEMGAGEMWNSNSLISWLLACSGHDTEIGLPARGRAPGWDAGLVVAARTEPGTPLTPLGMNMRRRPAGAGR